jgi:excisionase family DNA binding protein
VLSPERLGLGAPSLSKEVLVVTKNRERSDLQGSGGEALLSPEQLAEYLGIGRTFAYQLLAKKRIPSFTIGKLRRVRKSDVDRYVEERLSAEG